MERRRFYPVSSGIMFAAALTVLSSFVKAPPNDGACGPETLVYQARNIAERDGIAGVLPPGCAPDSLRRARALFVARRNERERHEYFPSREIISREESVFVNSEREAEQNELASTQRPQ